MFASPGSRARPRGIIRGRPRSWAISGRGVQGVPVQGTSTNDNAPTGFVGELIESEVGAGAAVALTTIVAANVTTILITPGDWDVWGNIFYVVSVGTSNIQGSISDTSVTFPTRPGKGIYFAINDTSATINPGLPLGMKRFSVSVATTLYLLGFSTFVSGTVSAYGYIGARRVR